MDYQTEVTRDQGYNSDRARENGGNRKHNNGGLSGVKRHAVNETVSKSQQGTGNGTMTNVAEEQTITVTYNFNF
ncbi:P8 [Potato necrosis virus]|uniref:P8 n=1 Tax=Potato necrosis virus TaxID=1725329 RepID=A0A141G5I8_9TOMB|nr:P8 [Potato necrosis virus]ALF95242.1 P8 [Potato necrosis virus]